MADQNWKVELADAVVHLQSDRLIWNRFVKALEGYSKWADDNCVNATFETSQVMQGRAQQMRALLKLLHEAPETAKAANRKNTWPPLPNQIPT